MSQIDDKAFEDYLSRQTPVSQRYRELDEAPVPPALDRAVLARAHAAVKSRRPSGSRAWTRWAAPVALAASMVLTLAIVIESGVEEQSATMHLPPRAVYERPAATATQEAQRAPEPEAQQLSKSVQQPSAPLSDVTPPPVAPAPEVESVVDTAVTAARRSQESDARRDAVIAADVVTGADSGRVAGSVEKRESSVQPPAPAAATGPTSAANERGSVALEEVLMTGARRTTVAAPRSGPRDTVSGVPARAEGPTLAQARSADPEQWLAYIRELRKDGEQSEADREWRAFREAYPDYNVVADDPARAR